MQLMVEAIGAHMAGDRLAARSGYQTFLALQPGHPQASQLLAMLELHEGSYLAAARLLEAAIAMQPEDPQLHENLGVARRQLKQHELALQSLDKAIALKPTSALAHGHRGAALQALGRPDEARQAYDHALMLDPRDPEILTWRGALARGEHQPEEALRYLDKALACKPDLAVAHCARGLALRSLGRIAEAVEAYDKAIVLAPQEPAYRYGQSVCLLTLGDYERGWRFFEDRYAVFKKREFEQPAWTGEQPLAGKVLLLHHDQGLGDMIMMARFAATAASLGARVVLESPPRLTSLLSRVAGVHDVITLGDDLPPFDFQCPVMSLPAVLKIGRDNIPGSDAYLTVDGSRAAEWARRLGSKTRPRIGIAWAGNPGHENDRHRSLALHALLPTLHGLPADIVSLQKAMPESDVATAKANPWLRSYEAQLTDFEETAALCAHMDLIVTVDTSIVHLAGALGRPTWLLPPFPPDYRWPLFEEACPWYRSVRTMWQAHGEGWAPLLDRVRSGLIAWLDHPELMPLAAASKLGRAL
jgi:tetratricopeptide (TPR) repeat protein